jgi:hypothetical protein
MPQWLQDLLIGIVSGTIAGFIGGVGTAIVVAYGAAGLVSGVWNIRKQIDGVRDIVSREDFYKRWAAWQTYVSNVNSDGPSNDTPFHRLVREIQAEFGSFPHPDFPPGSMSNGFAAVTLDVMPLLTRNIAVRGAIDKVRDRMGNYGAYPPQNMSELLTYLYWLLN